MKGMIRSVSLLALVLVTATACTRRVQVESEPNEPRYMQSSSVAPAEIEMAGVYDYVADFEGGERTEDVMTVRRSGDGYAVDIVSELGEVTTSDVRREGNTLTMDAMTPGGPGRVELTWKNANELTGEVYIGDVIRLSATRRP